MSKRFPNRHISPVRLGVLALMISAVVFGLFQGWRWFENTQSEAAEPWFAPYVDVTATPSYPFEQPRTDADENIVLSFVVADPDESCTPSWGAAYSLDEAQTELDLERRLARLGQQGGEAMVSFGGLLNDELATVCTDENRLRDAYSSVIDRYEIRALDFDIEGTALTDTASVERRAAAVAQLQKNRAAKDEPVAVWMTLPVTPDGLTPDGTDAVASMLDAGVELTGLNIMTMDYGESKAATQTMGDAAEQALESTHRQLGILYDRTGTSLTDRTLWGKLGVTPMIGQNDVVDEVFTLDDAEQLNAFVREKGIARTSMWSLNRDTTCGPNYDDVSRVSDACSGVEQGDSSFAVILGADLDGTPLGGAGVQTTNEPLPPVQTDDPDTSPYRIWEKSASYREGTRVVWHQNVYEAKWWTRGDLPDNPVLQEFETPWRLIGPVLPGETPIPIPTVAPGTFPDWSGDAIYERGDRVLFDGLPYEAKWWNQAASPQESEIEPDSSPWLALDPKAVNAETPAPTE